MSASRPEVRRFDKFTPAARKALQLSNEEQMRFRHDVIGSEHLLLGIVRHELSRPVFREVLGVDLDDFRREVLARRPYGDVDQGFGPLTQDARDSISEAVSAVLERSDKRIGVSHLTSGLIRVGHGMGYEILMNQCQQSGIDPEGILVARIHDVEPEVTQKEQ